MTLPLKCESNALSKQNSCSSLSMATDECMFGCIYESVAPTDCKTIISAQAIKIANDIYRLNASKYKNKHRFCISNSNRYFDTV